MWIIMSCWIIIVLMLFQTYQEGKNNNIVRLSYRQSKCSSCKQYNSINRTCNLAKRGKKPPTSKRSKGWR